MSSFSTAASDALNRYVYPPFVAFWNTLRNLTGRQRRAAEHADHKEKSAEKKRRKALWNKSHDR